MKDTDLSTEQIVDIAIKKGIIKKTEWFHEYGQWHEYKGRKFSYFKERVVMILNRKKEKDTLEKIINDIKVKK